MKINYKGCTIKSNRDTGSDGISRVYVSAVDESNGYIVVEEPRVNITVYEGLKGAKMTIDNYRGNEEEWVKE